MTMHQPAPAPTRHPAGALTPRSAGLIAAGAAAAGALAASAALNHRRARAAERANPPLGRFVEVEGVRLHYLERGTGVPLVLLHGNGGMIQDFLSSGLVDRAAGRHRVIVFDRPGYGYSDRPRGRLWTPEAQADLLAAALRRLGVAEATVLGHSWAGAVAVAMADRHPDLVAGLVLEAGYFYPTARADVLPLSVPALPVLGDLLRRTVSPWVGRLIWPLLMRRIFGPQPEPRKFHAFPREMALRPLPLRAASEESAMMIPAAAAAQGRYRRLRVPVAIIAGADDRMVTTDRQSARLHRELRESRLTVLPGTGHMVHQTATEEVLSAVEEVRSRRRAAPQLAPEPAAGG